MIFLVAPLALVAQVFTLVDSSRTGVSFRGLSMANERVVWVSGSKGTVGKSTDGGKTWHWVNPAGYDKRDFRDVEAMDEHTALAMAVDSPGIILKTNDGGRSWKVVYEDHRPGIFLDAMDFNGLRGACVGDPLDGRFVLLTTANAGDTWERLAPSLCPEALPGEACFAASGTNIVVPEADSELLTASFVTGGSSSRLHTIANKPGIPALPLTLQQGGRMTGANSLLMTADGFIAVGGDYTKPERQDSTIQSMVFPRPLPPASQLRQPLGYLSAIAQSKAATLVSGLRGIAWAKTEQLYQQITEVNWQRLSGLPFHVVDAIGNTAFAAGPDGRVARITFQ
jgi:hypothetical protein